jgi:hypothetical protein
MWKTVMTSVACGVGAVVYYALYCAFESRNKHMGFHGDFDAASTSCARLATFLAIACAASAALCLARGGVAGVRTMLRKRSKRKMFGKSSGVSFAGDRSIETILPLQQHRYLRNR